MKQGKFQATTWPELPLDIVQLLLKHIQQVERLQHAALVCKAWNTAACSLCSTVTTAFNSKASPSKWSALSRAYFVKRWLEKHGQFVVNLQLDARSGSSKEVYDISLPCSCLCSLRSLVLNGVALSHDNWASLCNISDNTALVSTGPRLAQLALTDCPANMAEIAAIQLKGLTNLHVTSWEGQPAELAAALASSSSSIAELVLERCAIHSTAHSNAIPQTEASKAVSRAEPAASNIRHVEPGDAAAPLADVLSTLANLPQLQVLELRHCDLQGQCGSGTNCHAGSSGITTVLGLQRLALWCTTGIHSLEVLHMTSPATLTHLELHVFGSTTIPQAVYNCLQVIAGQVATFRRLQHCVLKLCCPGAAADMLSTSRMRATEYSQLGQLSQLSYLGLTSFHHAARDVCMALFSTPAALPGLKRLSITGQLSKVPRGGVMRVPPNGISAAGSGQGLVCLGQWYLEAQVRPATSATVDSVLSVTHSCIKGKMRARMEASTWVNLAQIKPAAGALL